MIILSYSMVIYDIVRQNLYKNGENDDRSSIYVYIIAVYYDCLS